MKGKLLLAILLSVIVLSGCTQQTTNTGTPNDGTPDTSGDSSSGQSGNGTDSGTTPQDDADQGYEDGEDTTNLPEVAAVDAVSQSAGVARFYAVITGTNGGEIFFAKPEDPGSQGKQNNQGNSNQNGDSNGTNDTNTDDSNNAGKGKPTDKGKPSIDFNALTSLEIVVSEVSIHLSRTFEASDDTNQGQVPDLNQDTPDQNQNIDLNESNDQNQNIPDLNQNNDQNQNIDLNQNIDQNQNADLNQNVDLNQNNNDTNQLNDSNSNNDTNQNNDTNANFAAADQNKSKGGEKWIIVSNEEQTFDLLDLETTEALLADAEIPAGQYTQIRLQIVSATAVIDGNSYEVTVPPSKLMLNGVFSAGDLESVFVALDFDVEKSLKATGDGKLILRPTIKLRIVENSDVNA